MSKDETMPEVSPLTADEIDYFRKEKMTVETWLTTSRLYMAQCMMATIDQLTTEKRELQQKVVEQCGPDWRRTTDGAIVMCHCCRRASITEEVDHKPWCIYAECRDALPTEPKEAR